MNIDCFFPVYKKDDIKKYLTNFKASQFFKNNSNINLIFVCETSDENNLKILKQEIKANKKSVLLTLNKTFTYNDAFKYAIDYFNADVVMLGDTSVGKIDLVFEKCLDKYKKNASVVHIVKKQTKFKKFFQTIIHSIYNFFIKVFTDKTDRLNVISLGLIDKNVLDVLKTLPNKCCFLKNTKNLLGFETRTIYIPPKTETYKLNFKIKTSSLVTAIVSGVLNIAFIIMLIMLNCFVPNGRAIYNIIVALFIIFSLSIFTTTLPKHFFDIRNYWNREETLELKEIKLTK